MARFDHRGPVFSLLKAIQHLLAYRILQLRDVIDAVVSPSHFLAGVFARAELGSPVRVIRNPVHLGTELPESGAGRTRTPRSERLVYLGRVAPEKGLPEFIALLGRTGRTVSLDIYGTGPAESTVRVVAGRYPSVSVRLHQPVPRSEVGRLLAEFDALVYPSIWLENAPIVIIEAITAGLPVIVPDRGGATEMAHCGQLWAEFRHGDHVGLAAALDRTADFTRRNRLRDPAEFDPGRYRERIHELYSDLLSRNVDHR